MVGAVVVDKDNRVLMCRSPKWNNKYTFSGGHIEFWEKMADACKREAREEMGADIEILGLLYVDECFVKPPQFKRKAHFVCLDFLCRLKKGSAIKTDGEELTDWAWMPIDEAIEKTDASFVPTLKALKKKIKTCEKSL